MNVCVSFPLIRIADKGSEASALRETVLHLDRMNIYIVKRAHLKTCKSAILNIAVHYIKLTVRCTSPSTYTDYRESDRGTGLHFCT